MSMNSKNALVVKNISKVFTIPHEKISTLRGLFVNMFRQKSYEKFHALKNISFTVKEGECFGIIGRNGSGKSTLLKILANVYTPNTGECFVHGKISPFLELGIGFNPELSGRDNVYLNASVLGMLEKEIDAAYNSIVAFAELDRFMDQKLKKYSSGMKVRLAFSVAIHANREILLLDEVLAVGDSAFQEKCLRELKRLRSEGKTIILVSHSDQSIRDFADRVLVLNNGTMKALDTPDKALDVYAKLLTK